MAGQVQKTSSKKTTEEIQELPEAVETPEVDDLLDEIDAVLEENAEEFLAAFVQTGGQ